MPSVHDNPNSNHDSSDIQMSNDSRECPIMVRELFVNASEFSPGDEIIIRQQDAQDERWECVATTTGFKWEMERHEKHKGETND